ncbi:type IV pilus biogenesis protein PilO [Psychromonas sp. CNPT3]|uniref:type 4a pilus biogenesis protein PilO n=1 Tax=Psychromonas sp. CNPT3 TaxID=314282 RepID=UPI00006E5061|nr:type 4a pilus biogenesis protein PilO [Psychromonas sp. CNPT3]AGH82480.1 type IV pilus biogenesis protein PilO [Psychromonas sp. CNPT3]
MDLNELDFENVGSWPALYRGLFIAFCCVLISGAFFYFVTTAQLDELEAEQNKEFILKKDFKLKAALASNLEAYQEQMIEIHVILDELIQKLPSKKEIASLLDDISFIGANNGLLFKSINWGALKDAELSVEVPITIEVEGNYQQLGQFAADIAALPRIVILDRLLLKKTENGTLSLNVIAKTYRYKGDKK